jgi:LmbE family N-acetylglucosaminyl deacetylase
LVTTAPRSALAIYAHPDDPEVSCGGTLAAWAAAGAQVHVLVCCRGDKGSLDPATDTEALSRRRSEEMSAAAAVLGLSASHTLGLDDGDVTNSDALRHRLVEHIRRLRPEAVVCPDPTAAFFGTSYVNHRDHREVGWATLDAVAPAAWNPLYFPDAGPPHRVATLYLSGTLEPDGWVDVSAVIDRKAEALLCHASQLGEGGEFLRTFVRERAEEAGAAAGVRFAEAFRVLHPS